MAYSYIAVRNNNIILYNNVRPWCQTAYGKIAKMYKNVYVCYSKLSVVFPANGVVRLSYSGARLKHARQRFAQG